MPRSPQSLRANLDLVVVIVAIVLALSFGIVNTYALYENTLAVHPEWTPTKPTLRRGVMGAMNFVTSQQALARNMLNLGSWFGFQEVIYREPTDLESIEFAFRLEPDGYVHALFDHRADSYSGVRLSSRPDFPSSMYRATAAGEFTNIEQLPLIPLAPDVWHRAGISFTDDRATVIVDGKTTGVFARKPGPQRVGFRGGQRNAWIDDVSLTDKSGQVQLERFSNTTHRIHRLGFVFGGFLVLVLLSYIAARRFSSLSARDVGMGITMSLMILGILVACGYGLQYLRASNYSLSTDDGGRREAYWIDSSRREILADIRSRYAARVPSGVFRILVLGSSQTWGAGAQLPEDAWPRQLEKRLNQADQGVRFELINAGVSGLRAAAVLDILRNDLAHMEATAAIVNLSNNDADTVQFEQDLGKITAELKARNMRAVLTLEPNSLERKLTDSSHGDLSAKHAVVRAVASRNGLPVIDLHGYLAEQKDRGFLWWDFVHLTSFGQRLVADKLADDLPPLLGIK